MVGRVTVDRALGGSGRRPTPPSEAAASRDRLGLALVGMLALIGVSLIVIAALKFSDLTDIASPCNEDGIQPHGIAPQSPR